MTEVYVKSTTSGESVNVFHTDRDCCILEQALTVITREKDRLRDGMRECKHCSGEIADSGGIPDHSTHLRLEDADPEDLMTDGGTAENPSAKIETDATLEHRLSAIQLCVHEEHWERAEDGLLDALAEVRKRQGGVTNEDQD